MPDARKDVVSSQSTTVAKFDLFFSYPWVDAAVANRLADALVKKGVKLWLDRARVERFADITRAIDDGLTHAKAILSFYSEGYAKSRICQWELTAAYIAAQRTGSPGDRVLLVNPVSKSSHIPEELLRNLYATLPTNPTDADIDGVAKQVLQHVAALHGPLGALPRLQPPTWYPKASTAWPRFVGRVPQLWRIHSLLHKNESVGIHGRPGAADAALVHGMAGIGKTMLAEEYAHRFGLAYPGGIFWLRAKGENQAVTRQLEVQNVAEHRGISTKDLSHAQVVAALHHDFKSKGKPCLWVVDDLPPGLSLDEVRDWLAPHPLCRTLFTTRSQRYSVGEGVELGVLESEEALELLRKCVEEFNEADVPEARKLLEDLGHHALACEVVGARLKTASINEVRQALVAKEEDALAFAAEFSKELPHKQQTNVTALLFGSIEMLKEEGRDFLRLASILVADPIQKQLVRGVFEKFGRTAEHGDLGLDQAKQLSLAQRIDADTWSVHGLVSRAVRFLDQEKELIRSMRDATGTVSLALSRSFSGRECSQLLAEATAAFRSVLEVRTREQLPQDWAATQNNLGSALSDQGTRMVGDEGNTLLAQAVSAYRAALEVYTREHLPQHWAATQSNLGEALRNQGTRTAGDDGNTLLAQAVSACRAALEVYTREQLPRDWAATQNNLGNALSDQGTRTVGDEGNKLLTQAVSAYGAALEVYTREHLPQDWATTQNNLGAALSDQGTRTVGDEGNTLFAQAVSAYGAAFEVRTREHLPQDWAATQNNLGNALHDQGTRTASDEGNTLLAQAVSAYRAALEVYTREHLPQHWAMTQNNLGAALCNQGKRTAGDEGNTLLAQGVSAYGAALEVRTREHLPQDWAATQNNLGNALHHQGTRTAGEEGSKLLAQAVSAYRAALEVYTREHLPQHWAATQNNLGNALSDQGTRTVGDEGNMLLAQAVSTCRAALEVYTREPLPRDWAMTQNNLGAALCNQGMRTAGDEGNMLLAQAVSAYRAALEVRVREHLPQDWAMTQDNLGEALGNQGKRTAGDDGSKLLAQAVSAHRAALEVYTREQLPQQWANAYRGLARLIQDQLDRASGDEAARLRDEQGCMAEALRAYEAEQAKARTGK